jgi:hypothetical protein
MSSSRGTAGSNRGDWQNNTWLTISDGLCGIISTGSRQGGLSTEENVLTDKLQ